MNLEELSKRALKGFMAVEEATRLYEVAREAARHGPCLEIGGYCGLSAAYLGLACRERGSVLFSLDHHEGSEEQQPGAEYFDEELLDPQTGRIDTFPMFRKTIRDLNLENTVVSIVARSAVAARFWRTPLSLVLIDGGHSFEAVFTDYNSWAAHIQPGGFLLIHDIFFDAAQGGQAPRCIYQMALASGLYAELPLVRTLGILQRLPPEGVSDLARERWRRLSV